MTEDRFSLKNIENATICSNEINPNQESAISFLNEWCEQPNSIFSALNLIQVSTVLISKFISSSLIKNKIVDYWNQMEQDQKENYRNTLALIIYSLDDINDNISYNLIHSLCTIAIFDWPNDYPTFSEIFDRHENYEETKITIRILSTFLNEIDETNIITDNHRNDLRQLIISQYLEKFEYICQNYLLIPEMSNDILIIYKYFLKWCRIDGFFFELEIFSQIIQLLLNELTSEKVIECLNWIFISKEINESTFLLYFPPFLHFLSANFCQKEKEISFNSKFLVFLMDFLRVFSDYVGTLFILDHDETRYIYNQNLRSLVPKFIVQSKSLEIDHETIFNEYKNLFYLIFASTSEEMVDDLRVSYQNLFKKVIKFCHNEVNSNTDTTLNFYISMINDILLSVYNSQNLFEYNEGDISIQMDSMLKHLYLIDQDSFIKFLKEQQPSPKMCWAIGSIKLHVDESRHKLFANMLVGLIQYLEVDNSNEYLSSLLFALSKWTCCFSLGNQLFPKFNEIIFNAITKNDEKLAFSAASSFYEVVNNHTGLYKNECLSYIEFIINNGREYLINLNEKSSEKIFLACTKLIRYYKHINQENNPQKNEEIDIACQSLHVKLIEPLIYVLNNIGEFSNEIVDTAFNIIGKSCIYSTETANNLFEFVWTPLFQLAYNSIPNSNVPSKLIELILNTIAKILIKFDFQKASPFIASIINLMKERERVEDCYFIYFAKLRIFFKEMNDVYEEIFQQFVLPFIEHENSPSAEMFKMLEKFKFDVVNVEWFTFILIETIKNLGTDVVNTAITCFIHCIRFSLSDEMKIAFIKNCAPELIKTIIKSITDLLHKPLLLGFCEIIKCMFELAGSFVPEIEYSDDIDMDVCDEENEEQAVEEEEKKEEEVEHVDADELFSILKGAIVSSLSEFAQEPQDGFFVNFVEYICSRNENEIREAFSNLLIMFRKALPCDMDIYKIDNEDDFSEDDQNSGLDEQIDDIDRIDRTSLWDDTKIPITLNLSK